MNEPALRSDDVRKLEETQLEAFDHDFIAGEKWDHISKWIEGSFPDGDFSFLDVGGGNGSFADLILDRFPRSNGVVLDNGERLLTRNKPHPHKTTVADSAENLQGRFSDRKFDLISFNWILHHLVKDSYARTREFQQQILGLSRQLLSPRGRIFVMECMYEGLVHRGYPGWLIYTLTSSRALAPITRKLGANTAGCGVCFLNLGQWEENFRRAGLHIQQTLRYHEWNMGALKRMGLLIRSVHDRQFLLAPTPALPLP